MNISSGLPSGSTTADYNRLVSTKVEFIKVNELPTSYMKPYPYIYILLDGSKAVGMYEYNENSKSWIRYGADIVDNLTSTATNKPLSAAQGKVLNDNITNINNESLGVGNVTISADGNTFTQTFSDGRVTTLTKTDTGFREIRKDASGNVISDITTTVSDNGTITSTKTS